MGEITRRAVLGVGAGAIGVVTLGVGPAAAAATPGSAPVRADYAGAIGRVFTAEHAGHRFRVRLTHVRDVSPTTAKHRPYCFVLIFAPVGGLHLRDGIYTLHRRGVAAHRLFMSSVGTDRRMQAVINRRH